MRRARLHTSALSHGGSATTRSTFIAFRDGSRHGPCARWTTVSGTFSATGTSVAWALGYHSRFARFMRRDADICRLVGRQAVPWRHDRCAAVMPRSTRPDSPRHFRTGRDVRARTKYVADEGRCSEGARSNPSPRSAWSRGLLDCKRRRSSS
eukprot:Amastigsp_a509716_29.p5 type:complete len:152 gc:universal Amastigsp_a509716_29:1960-1505(-)